MGLKTPMPGKSAAQSAVSFFRAAGVIFSGTLKPHLTRSFPAQLLEKCGRLQLLPEQAFKSPLGRCRRFGLPGGYRTVPENWIGLGEAATAEFGFSQSYDRKT